MKTDSMALKAATAVIAALLLTPLAACGGDADDGGGTDDTASSSADATPDVDSSGTAGSGPITVENLADRCDELTSIVTVLRAEAPAEVKPSAVTNANNNGFKARTAHCTYAYEGDDFSDKNRVDVYIDSAPGDAAGMKAYWDEIASTQPLMMLDGADEATWYTMTGTDAKSSARALIDDTMVSVRVTVPKDMENEVFMSKVVAADALQAVVDLM